jgi:hypothetical protein
LAPNEKAKAGAQHEDFQMSTDHDARLAFEPLVMQKLHFSSLLRLDPAKWILRDDQAVATVRYFMFGNPDPVAIVGVLLASLYSA